MLYLYKNKTCTKFYSFTAVYKHSICRGGGWGVIRLFWCYYGVTYIFIQNHNQCRDLHQNFSCLFETFGFMSEIMFSSDSMSKKYFFNSWKYMNVYFRFQQYCFGLVGKQWFKNVRTTVIFLIYHFWFQLISIVIHIQAILDFQSNLYFQETRQTNATISCHFEKKNEFFIKTDVFPVKSKLQKPFWLQSYGINFQKVNFFILEQIRIIEFCPFDH